MTVEYVGPFDETWVVINGRQVPHLRAHKDEQGVVRALSVSNCMIDLPPLDPDRPFDTENLVRFIADAIAAGMGYCGFPDDGSEPVKRPDFPRVHSVETGGNP